MAIESIMIPPLLSALGVLTWSTGANTEGLLSKSKSFAKDIPDKTSARARLARMGRENEYGNFRVRQYTWALFGSGIAFISALLAVESPLFAILVSGMAGTGTYFAIDHQLSRDVMKYRLAIESEFASIIEMLTLSLSAGETPLSAMARISRRSHGALAFEFDKVISSVRQGMSFQESLDALGRRVDSVVIRRFVDSLINAMSRGAPLIEVLQRHAAEARQNQRNILMDKAGRAEMSMMVPVVFLILPISVLFALWPSLTHLSFFAG